jgi:hypothetical protein
MRENLPFKDECLCGYDVINVPALKPFRQPVGKYWAQV